MICSPTKCQSFSHLLCNSSFFKHRPDVWHLFWDMNCPASKHSFFFFCSCFFMPYGRCCETIRLQAIDVEKACMQSWDCGQLILQGLKSTECLGQHRHFSCSAVYTLPNGRCITMQDDTRPTCARNLRFVLSLHRQSESYVAKRPHYARLPHSFFTQAINTPNKF